MSQVQVTSFAMPALKRHVLTGGKRGSKYDLASLRAGTDDCIILAGLDAKKDHSKLSSAVVNFRKTGGQGKFTIRTFTVTENGVEQTRVGVWRLADSAADEAAE